MNIYQILQINNLVFLIQIKKKLSNFYKFSNNFLIFIYFTNFSIILKNKMIKRFNKNQISKILNEFDHQLEISQNRMPLDVHLRNHFKKHKALGASDRRTISENIYKLIRHKIYLDKISQKPLSWDTRIEAMLSQKFNTMKDNTSLEPHVRCSSPQDLYDLVVSAYGSSQGFNYLENINNRAPLTVRVNPYKISRDELLYKWSKIDKFAVKKTQFSPLGISFTGPNNENLFDLPEFKRGYFEIQDEASQLVALKVNCQPGQKILDYCCGAAGKSLAFAPYTKGLGKIYLHDIRENILIQAKKRLKRAGIQNIELTHEKQQLKKLKGNCDWVIADVPCSGTGTLRRNPDLKLKFSMDRLEYYVELQQSIVDETIQYLKPKNGKLVYMTCSLLPQENIFQVEKICEKHNMEVVDNKHFQSLPDEPYGMDSFFSATLQFKHNNN